MTSGFLSRRRTNAVRSFGSTQPGVRSCDPSIEVCVPVGVKTGLGSPAVRRVPTAYPPWTATSMRRRCVT